MFRTYPLHSTAARRPESLRDIVRRLEQELSTDDQRAARRRVQLAVRPRPAV
jgi:hypothetical protein